MTHRGGGRAAWGCLLSALWLAAAVTAAAGEPASEARGALPVSSQGVLSIEPPRLAIGEVATAERVIVTPPGGSVVPAPPPEVPGVWVLDAEPLPVEKEPARWVHRTRFRLRARALGLFVWPTQRVEVEWPDQSRTSVTVEGRPIEVVSILPRFPDRMTPFGLREPEEAAAPAGRGGLLAGVALGAGGVLAALAARVAWRHRRARQRAAALRAAAAGSIATGSREQAHGELRAARRLLEQDPRAGADAAARALRRFATAWFVLAAESRTVEELASAAPRPGSTPRWADCLALLGALDDLRFRPEVGALPPDPRLEQAVGAAERLFAGPGAPELA